MSEEEPHKILLHMTVEALGSPGFVVNSDLASRSPCKCYTYHGEPKLCFSKGIIGSMSKGQIESYCKPMIKLGESKRITEWMEAKDEALKEFHQIPEGKRKIEDWLSAMGKALRKKGIEI